jgi:cyclophilin family peptidyl-prolyl cis-trans isomerase
MLKKSIFLFIVILILPGCVVNNFVAREVDKKVQSAKIDTPAAVAGDKNINMNFDAQKHYTAILHTSKGDIEVALNFGQTSKTVENFVTLSRKNFYDNTIFHRVIKDFMIQGGDPEGTGMGGPGYKFADEPFTGDYTRGTVAMANSGPNTNGSQFFIMHANVPLPKRYVIFGHVVKGLEVVDSIAESEVGANLFGEESTPVEPTKVLSVEIKEE